MVTIILPISRTDYLKPVFDSLAALTKPQDTELVIVTDGGEELAKAVDRRLDSVSFARIQVVEFGTEAAEDINSRRYRIAAIHNKAKEYVYYTSDYVFLIEDDTTYPPDTLTKLLDGMNAKGTAYVEAVELGRHKTPYVGAWRTNDIDKPSIITSLLPPENEADVLEDIDAGGLYCCLVDATLYKEHTFEPFDKHGVVGLSCDFNFGLWLKRRGRLCYIDWSIQCDHIGDKGSRNLGNTRPVRVEFTLNNKSQWDARTLTE